MTDFFCSEYPKIMTVWKRDPATKYRTLLEGEYALPEFGYLAENEWLCTEKVDGTNVRVIYTPLSQAVQIRGKTDRAELHSGLVERTYELFPVERLASVFDAPVCLYGEGFGAKIQKGGGLYRDHQDFILFDVRIGDWWLERHNVVDIAQQLEIDVVPIIGSGSLNDAILRVRRGFNSWVARESRPAEGLVMRPRVELRARDGSRMITKIKSRDFRDG